MAEVPGSSQATECQRGVPQNQRGLSPTKGGGKDGQKLCQEVLSFSLFHPLPPSEVEKHKGRSSQL